MPSTALHGLSTLWVTTPGSEVTTQPVQKEGLSEELKNIISISLMEEGIEGSSKQPGCSRQSDDQYTDSTSDVSSESEKEESNTLVKMRQELDNNNNNDKRRWQLTVMLQNVESTNKTARERHLAHQRSFLVDLGLFDKSKISPPPRTPPMLPRALLLSDSQSLSLVSTVISSSLQPFLCSLEVQLCCGELLQNCL